ncbi:Uncharacterised protein [Mycobacteroides abscessus subsp. abscessus]|uniref:hypothetical protein n=1 Tax=Mycobacteroides abscessus TaxID=36809 RepID=UPI0009281AE1|nr:hypothetical protein [Mycobacteroides abscessus]SIH20162.1 Uncharacterised protein [Mycobacteroides abscessus subsp. abscessus]
MTGEKPESPDVVVIRDGQRRRLLLDDVDTDVLGWLESVASTSEDAQLFVLTRQQVATRLGGPVPDDFFEPDVILGADPQLGIEGEGAWFPQSVQRYLSREDTPIQTRQEEQTPVEEQEPEPQPPTTVAPAQPDVDPIEPLYGPQWDPEAVKSEGPWEPGQRVWADIAKSGADYRMLIVTADGVATPSGWVFRGPLKGPDDLLSLVQTYPWDKRLLFNPKSGDKRGQIWFSVGALDGMGVNLQGVSAKQLQQKVGEQLDVNITYALSGWFTGKFALAEGGDREVELVLMPLLGAEASTQRPNDRGLAGIKGKPSYLPNDELAAAHTLADRMYWLYHQGDSGTMAGPRWTDPAVQILGPIVLERTKPKAVHSNVPPALKASVLPDEIVQGKLAPRFWEKWVNPDATPDVADVVNVELDQKSAYLPAVEKAVLGYGDPVWVKADPSVYLLEQPPFQIAEIVVPAANTIGGLNPNLPLPLPQLDWDNETRFPAITVDVQQLLAPVAEGGCGLDISRIKFVGDVYQWPEQHRWLRGAGKAIRVIQEEALTDRRYDRVDMTKAIHTSFWGKMSSTDKAGAWKFPWTQLQQPAWYWTIESLCRWSSMKYVVRIATDHKITPHTVVRDAWIFRLPADKKPDFLEDALIDGKLRNGKYRVKNIWPVVKR